MRSNLKKVAFSFVTFRRLSRFFTSGATQKKSKRNVGYRKCGHFSTIIYTNFPQRHFLKPATTAPFQPKKIFTTRSNTHIKFKKQTFAKTRNQFQNFQNPISKIFTLVTIFLLSML
jgi:hypothetical protein